MSRTGNSLRNAITAVGGTIARMGIETLVYLELNILATPVVF